MEEIRHPRIDTSSEVWKLREARMWLIGGAVAVLHATHKGGFRYLDNAVRIATRAGMNDEDILVELWAVELAKEPDEVRELLAGG